MSTTSITNPATTTTVTSTSARLGMMLTDLRLPTIKRLAGDLCAQSDTEGWPAHRLLEALLEHEINEREAVQTSARRAARVAREPDARAYRLYAVPFAGASPDQVDLEVAKNMLKAHLSHGEVAAALRTSPGLAGRHPDAERHVKEIVNKARKALNLLAP